MALTAAACMTACDDSSSSSYEIPAYQSDTSLPDTCSMEVAKVDTAYFACFENKWIEVTDSATIEQLKEGLDEEEIKAKLEELQSLLVKPADNTPKPTSSSAAQGKVESSDKEGSSSSSSEEAEEPSSSSKKKKDKDKDDSGEGGSGSGEGGSGSGEGGSSEPSGPSAAELKILGTCDATLKDTVKWTGEFTSAGSLIPDETKAGKYFACNGTKWAEVTKLHYAFGATCEAFKNRIQEIYDLSFINDPDNWTDPFTEKALNSDLNVLTDGNGIVLSSGGKMLGRLVPAWNGKTEIYTYDGVVYSNPLCKDDKYTVAPVGASAIRRLCTKNNVGDRGRAFKQGSTVYGDNYWVCYEKGDGTYEWGQGFVDSRTRTGVVGDPLRFGTIYRMVNIDEQTWMAENVNYETSTGSSCYDGESANCDKYGRLYTWAAANTACPTGWHLPTLSEWQKLTSNVGTESTAGKSLKATSGWKEDGNGTDDYGFSALPAGGKASSTGKYGGIGEHTSFWSQTTDDKDAEKAYDAYMYGDQDFMYTNPVPKTNAFPVRCIKDAE